MESDMFFDMGELGPKQTGLPFTVFHYQKTGSMKDIYIKIGTTHKTESIICTLKIKDKIKLVSGKWTLGGDNFNLLSQWVNLNKEILSDYWEGNYSTTDFISRIVKV